MLPMEEPAVGPGGPDPSADPASSACSGCQDSRGNPTDPDADPKLRLKPDGDSGPGAMALSAESMESGPVMTVAGSAGSPADGAAGHAAAGCPLEPSTAVAGCPAEEATEVGDYFVAAYPPFSVWQSEHAATFEAALKLDPSLAASPWGLAPTERPFSLYLHLPFCRQRCYYCYFRVHPAARSVTVDEYIDAALVEAALYREHPALRGRPLRHVYLGGGTPTYLTVKQLERLIAGLRDLWSWRTVGEVTVEADPGTVSLEKLQLLRELGVNRLSLGFQTLTPGLGFRIGRLAGRNDCIQAYWLARTAGFENINIDMLAGLQGEILESWVWSVGQVADLEPESITMCQLQLTHNSKYFAQKRAGRALPLPSWTAKREWVGAAFENLEKRGWKVADGYTAVRRPEAATAAYTEQVLWRGEDLLGLGESAFGMLAGFNYQNSDTLETYLAPLRRQQLPIRRAYRLSDDERLRRELLLSLKSGRVDLGRLRIRYKVDVRETFKPEFDGLVAEGLAELRPEWVMLTRAGLLQVDALLPRFYRKEHRGLRYT
ncbi:MAG: coproporphyrinogen-III oxidase family protein [Planctomycetota bacterium]